MFNDRRDANPVHVKEFRESVKIAKKAWFNDVFGQRQLNLLRLATHPDYQRHGAGTVLVQWGLAKAENENLAVTLFSSPMGERMYSGLGFHEVGQVRVHVAGEKAALEFPAMVYESDGLSASG